MSRARYEVEKLRHWIDKIDDLWDEEEQNCFAEVSQNSNDGKCHAREVIESVADENFWWIS